MNHLKNIFIKIDSKENLLKLILILESYGSDVTLLCRYYSNSHNNDIYNFYVYKFKISDLFDYYIGDESSLIEAKLSKYEFTNILNRY